MICPPSEKTSPSARYATNGTPMKASVRRRASPIRGMRPTPTRIRPAGRTAVAEVTAARLGRNTIDALDGVPVETVDRLLPEGRRVDQLDEGLEGGHGHHHPVGRLEGRRDDERGVPRRAGADHRHVRDRVVAHDHAEEAPRI